MSSKIIVDSFPAIFVPNKDYCLFVLLFSCSFFILNSAKSLKDLFVSLFVRYLISISHF